MRLLVAGDARVDAGKTTFSTGLCEYVGATGFKPRAGNDYWFDHDDYQRAVAQGRLYGKDAKRLAAASPGSPDPEDVNPLHRLWRPSPGSDSGMLGASHRRFVLDRVGDEYVVNANADVPESAREHLPLDDAIVVETLAELNEVMTDRHTTAFDRIREEILSRDRAVVESYADIALPIQDVAFDAVAVVEPERARVYGGERYAKACAVVGGSTHEGKLEERVSDVVSYCDPLATVGLPALGSDARADPERVADAYEVAYEAVVTAALS
ncbi:ATPase [Haloarchaeobius sp. HME9146]|uniref:ATPase n=1 Tax=Haloarchaeobius sp. HME9146 TaxID=2978732 RepID=UPI0021BEC9BC|nr:ATPase [Haloarchaeobius sp. HME9146]MCT9097285.1 ATPase [Haloarchaeobius sp. HME9146]